MQEKRQERLERVSRLLCIERKEIAMKVLRTFKISQITSSEIMPEGPDFCKFRPVIDVLNRPREEEITVSSFDAVIPLLPGLIAKWRENIHKSLVALIHKSHLDRFRRELPIGISTRYMENSNQNPPILSDEDATQMLKLATTVFECPEYHCHHILFYPQVLGHTCLTRTKNRREVIDDTLASTTAARRLVDHSVIIPDAPNYGRYGETQYRCIWRARLILRDHARAIAEDLVRLAGLDPTTATVDDMDQLDLRFVCRTCANHCIVTLFTWRAAVRFI